MLSKADRGKKREKQSKLKLLSCDDYIRMALETLASEGTNSADVADIYDNMINLGYSSYGATPKQTVSSSLQRGAKSGKYVAVGKNPVRYRLP